MRRLIDMYISSDPSRKISTFDDFSLIQLIVDRGEATGDALPSDIRTDQRAVAETIENNLRRVIIEESVTNPAYFADMSTLLDELIKERKEEALAYEAYLQKVVELTRKVNQPSISKAYPSQVDTRARQALYGNLGKDEFPFPFPEIEPHL